MPVSCIGPIFFALTLVCTILCKPSFDPYEIPPERNPEEGEYFQGDIEFEADDVTKAGLVNEERRWLDKTLVYQISTDFSDDQLDLIHTAINELTSRTCIKFKFREDEVDYVNLIKVTRGCSSQLGRIGGEQNLKLADGCFRVGWGTVAHEFIHSLGFVHEQARTDRDDFVKINDANIAEDKRHNFVKYDEAYINPFQVPYDYSSIMHYSWNAFAIDPSLPTIIPKKEGGSLIGQRKKLSNMDIQKLKNMYKCN